MRSVCLEIAAVVFIEQWTYRDKGLIYYDYMVRDFYAFLLNYSNGRAKPAGNRKIGGKRRHERRERALGFFHGSGVSEYKIDWGPGYRIYFGKDGESFVILIGGGTKKHQSFDIQVAKMHWTQYKRRKRVEKR